MHGQQNIKFFKSFFSLFTFVNQNVGRHRRGFLHAQNIKQFARLYTLYDVMLRPKTRTDTYITVSNAHNITTLCTSMKTLPVLLSTYIV